MTTVKRICQYLQGNIYTGLVFNTPKTLVTNCFADADFAGLWGDENPQDPIYAGSRTVFVVTFSNFPLLWVSKQQIDISISTLHYEYVALSHSVKSLLPLKSLIKEEIDNLGIDSEKLKFVSSSTIYEDNNWAIVVERVPRMTPTSKHIAFNYHWFRKHVGKDFMIWKIEPKNQKTVILTKGLQSVLFVRISNLLYGW